MKWNSNGVDNDVMINMMVINVMSNNNIKIWNNNMGIDLMKVMKMMISNVMMNSNDSNINGNDSNRY